MQRRGDDSDDDEGFKVSTSGRLKGSLPNFLPSIARDTSVVSVLYQSNRSGMLTTPSILGSRADDAATPAELRKRVIKEIAKRERRPVPQPELPPLPLSIAQRKRCETHMAISMKLRLDNSSPALSVARRQHVLQQARKESHTRRHVKRSKGWCAEDFQPGEGGRRSCPPTIGVGPGNGVPVAEEFAMKPWDDPAMLKRAAEIDAADRKARREQLQRDQAGGGAASEGTEVAAGAGKGKLRAPVNDATLDAEKGLPGHAYDFHRHRPQR